MNETMVTVVGHVATEPALRTTQGGARVASFRLASTERRFDRGANGWRDGSTTFFTVTSWRNMGENVCESVEKGQPVVVHGRLRDSSYDGRDGQRRTVLEIEAFALGHDLSRGVAHFTKSTVSSSGETNVVRELDELGAVDPVTGELLEGNDDGDFSSGVRNESDGDEAPAVTNAA
jgi:single-strand DNA-binding protein